MTPAHPWHSLCNLHTGRPAIVVGKGPSLGTWVQRGCPHPDGAVVIAINEAAHVIHAAGKTPDYAVSNHRRDYYVDVPTQWVVSLPEPPGDYQAPLWVKPNWAAHWFLHVHGRDLLNQTREDLADTRLLYNQSCSVQPAIHFAFYLGCASLVLVGVDGAGGYAPQAIEFCPFAPSEDDLYTAMAVDTQFAADTLFAGVWGRWSEDSTEGGLP